jgi:hypothetical protein
MPTTEVATLPPLAGTSISESDTTLQESLARIKKADGYQSYRFGASFEEPENVQLLVGKTSLPKKIRTHQTLELENYY